MTKKQLRKKLKKLQRRYDVLWDFAVETRRLIDPEWGKRPLRDLIPTMRTTQAAIPYVGSSSITWFSENDAPPDMGVVATVPVRPSSSGGSVLVTVGLE